MDKQDGFASMPDFYRTWCVNLKLSWALSLTDLGGKYHDYLLGFMRHFPAALYFSVGLLWNFILGFIMLGIVPIIFVIIYAIVPQYFKDLYWRFIFRISA